MHTDNPYAAPRVSVVTPEPADRRPPPGELARALAGDHSMDLVAVMGDAAKRVRGGILAANGLALCGLLAMLGLWWGFLAVADPGTLADLLSDAPEAKARFEHNKSLADDLRAKVAEAALGGPEKHRERHVSRGKLLPRDRVERLLDPGSPVLEVGQLAANRMYEGDVNGASMIAGIGRVSGRQVMIVCNDPTVQRDLFERSR